MPELLPQAPPLVTTQAPSPGISPGQIAQPYRELAETLSKSGEASESVAENAAEQAGYNAVTRGPDGQIQVERAPILGPASQAYSRAMKVKALAEGESDAKAADIKLRQQFLNDPDGYLEAANAFQQKTIADYSKAGAPEVGIALGRAIGSVTDQTYRGLWTQKQNRDLRTAGESIDAGIASARDDLAALARGGKMDSPAALQAWSKIEHLTQEKVSNPLFAYPQEKAQFDLQTLHGEVQANAFLHHVDQIYQDQGINPDGSTRGGARNALEAARSILTDPNLKLSEQQRQQYFAKATSEIHANEALRRQDIAEARAAEQDLNSSSYLGARVEPEQVEQVASAYRAAGDPGAAARLYAKFSRKPLNDDFGRQPLPAQVEQLRVLQSGANPSSAAEARLIGHESGGNPMSVNRFGYAGLYQFGAPLLADLGLYRPGRGENLATWSQSGANAPGKWTGTFNIPGFPDVKTVRDFLANPAAQKAAFDAHTTNMDAQIGATGLDRYIGQNVGGVPITREGLHAMIHLGGVEGTSVALRTAGRINPADANGTTLLDYARMGAGAGQGTPSTNLWLQTNRERTIQTQARGDWKVIMADYDKTGIRPADGVINRVVDAAQITNDHDLLEQIGEDAERMDLARRVAQAPLPEQATAIGSLERAGAAGELSPGQSAVLKDLQRKNEAITKGISTNPISTAVQNFPQRFDQPAPLNLGDPDAFATGLAQRARIAQFAQQNWQTGPLSALDAADLAQVKGALDTADPAAKARIFQGIATLPDAVRGATLAKLGGDNPATMADAAAGSMMRTAPDIALSIFRGQAALKADPKWGPTAEQGGKQGFEADLDKSLPATIFPQQARTDPVGPYATFTKMVTARYADLAAQAGDTKYSAARVEQAVQDVTGGTAAHNGRTVIVPARGMTQSQFDGVLQSVTDWDLDGVTTLNGAPITADYLRNSAQLENAGDGRYFVTLGRDPARPVYAYQYANTEIPNKFILDLRGRAPSFVPPRPAEGFAFGAGP